MHNQVVAIGLQSRFQLASSWKFASNLDTSEWGELWKRGGEPTSTLKNSHGFHIHSAMETVSQMGRYWILRWQYFATTRVVNRCQYFHCFSNSIAYKEKYSCWTSKKIEEKKRCTRRAETSIRSFFIPRQKYTKATRQTNFSNFNALELRRKDVNWAQQM
jgi:hypothetical protein